MDSITDNILSNLKKEVLKEITREKASRFTRIVKNEASAKNYAKAMFDTATELGKIEDIKKDLNIVYSSLLVDKYIFDFFKSNFIDVHLRMSMLKKVYENNISDETFNLIAILTERGLIDILFAIIVEYENLCNEYYNIVVAKITTSSVIEDTPEAEVLKDHIRSMIKGKDVHFTFHVDESIIGGVIVEMEDIVYDYSIRNLLTELGLSISDNG